MTEILEKPLKGNCKLDISPIQFAIDTEGFLGNILGFFKWRITPRLWILNNDFIFWCNHLNCWMKIPKGFVFDGASIPKILQFAINPTDAVLYGALVHDFIYRFSQLIVCSDENYGNWILQEVEKRKDADILLREVSKQYDKVPGAAVVVYWIIRPTGIFAWNRARKRNYKLTTTYPDPNNTFLRKGIENLL